MAVYMIAQATRIIDVIITPGQMKLMLLLSLSKQRSVRQLSLMLGVSSPATTKAVHRLVRKKLVMRTPNEIDHRSVEVSLTDIGLKLLQSRGLVLSETRVQIRLEC